MRGFSIVSPCAGVLAMLALGAGLLYPHLARADDLEAATLPESRSALVGQTVTAFATVINTSGRALSGCAVALTGFPVTVDYVTSNPATNAINGIADTPFSLAIGASQTLVLSFTPTAVLSPTDLPLVFSCSGANPAPSFPGLNTVLLSASNTQPPDLVALIATVSNDGVVQMPAINQAAAFAVASVNVGADATITVSADTGNLTPSPVTATICQTVPSTGACMAAPAASVTLNVLPNATPTFGVFVTSTEAVPFAPATTRVFVRFLDGNGVVRGATSAAISNGATVATAPTGGGIYEGKIAISGGADSGSTVDVVFIAGENGRFSGVTAASLSSPVNALFSGFLSVNTSLGFAASGNLIAAPGFTLPDGGTTSPLTVNGTLSPAGYVTGLFSTTNGETGALAASFISGLYNRPVTLSQFAGNWNLRDSSSVTGTVMFDSIGNFTGTGTGTNNSGCRYAGSVSVISANFNAESVTMTITGCALAGTYTGLAALVDFLGTDDTVVFGLSSSDNTQAQTSRLTRF